MSLKRLQAPFIFLLGSGFVLSASNSAVIGADANDVTYRLKYKFTPNQMVYFEVAHKTSITTTKGRASETAVNESKTKKHFRVVSVDKQNRAILESYIDRVEMTARFGENDPVVYDSRSDRTPPQQFRRVHETIGKPLARIKVAENGRFLDVVSLQGNPQQPGNASRNFLIVFPEKDLQIGETWSDRPKVKVNVGGNLQREIELIRKYKLVSVKDGQATIRLETSVLTPVRNPEIRGQLVQRTPSGTIVFDIAKGQVVSRELTIDQQEIGFAGADSSIRAVSQRTERLVSAPAVASKTGAKTGPNLPGKR